MRQNAKTLVLFAVILVFLSCQNSSLRPSAAALILHKGREGDYEYLKKVPISPHIAAALIRREPGSAYYLGLVYLDLSLPQQAETLFTATLVRDQEPWKKAAGQELHSLLSQEKNEKPLASAAQRFHKLYPQDQEGRIFLLHALEQEGRYQELLRYHHGFVGTSSPQELFIAAQAAKKLKNPQGKEALRRLFLDGPSHGVHPRALNALVSPEDFSVEELSFFRAKADLAAGSYAAALPGYRQAPAPYRHSPIFLQEYGTLLLRTAQYRLGISDLEKRLPELTDSSLLIAREQLGKLYRQMGAYEASISVLKGALNQWESGTRIQEDGEKSALDGDRLLWYILSSSLRQSPEVFLQEYSLLSKKIHDPSYFSDLFEILAAELLRQGRWELLREAYRLTEETAGTDHARFAFLLAQGLQADLFQSPPELPPLEELLAIAYRSGSPYHSILAGVALGKAPLFVEENPVEENPMGKTEIGEKDLFLQGFADFGLSPRGIEIARHLPEPPNPTSVVPLLEQDAARGRYIQGLRLLAWSARANPPLRDRRTLESLYPRAFREETEAVIGEFSLPRAIFYGLVREESYFDPEIRSHAGATGLAQLMPATAREVARSLGIHNPDLRDPMTNLRLGGRHLADLARRLGPGVFYLSAYNAGGGRLNQWTRQIKNLPQSLFAEALPYTETRDYIRKVLVAAVHYGYLYERKSPAETVVEIFSDFYLPSKQQETP